MIRKILLTILVCFCCSVAFAQTADTMVWTATPSIVTPATIPEYPEDPAAMNTVSVSNTATTTAVTVTALTGRKYITFTADGACWVKPGSTTTTISTGIPFSCGSMTLDLDGTVPISYISSTAVNVSVFQAGRKAIGFTVGKQQ